MELLSIICFHTKSSKGSMYVTPTAQLTSNQPHFKCPIAACDEKLPYQTMQKFQICKASPFTWMSTSGLTCKNGDAVHSLLCRRKRANLKVLCQLEDTICNRLSALCSTRLSNATPFSRGK